MRPLNLGLAVLAFLVATPEKAMATGDSRPHVAVALNSGLVGGFDLHRELAFDFMVVGNLPIARHLMVYAEFGVGTTFAHDQTMTLPLGIGFWYELRDSFSAPVSIGLAISYCGRVDRLSEGGFLVGPLLQVTLLEHTGSLGPMSVVAVPGLAGQVLPGRPSALGAGLTLGFEIELDPED